MVTKGVKWPRGKMDQGVEFYSLGVEFYSLGVEFYSLVVLPLGHFTPFVSA